MSEVNLQRWNELGIANMQLVWADANYGSFEPSVCGSNGSSHHQALTIFLVHFSDFESVLAEQYAVIVELVPQCGCSQSGAGKFGKRMKVQAIDHAANNVCRQHARSCQHRWRKAGGRSVKNHCENLAVHKKDKRSQTDMQRGTHFGRTLTEQNIYM